MSDIKAFFFDQDGVIIDTEKDGHRVAFNQTFREFGFTFEWDIDEYHELLKISGGKERMTHYLHSKGFGVEINPEQEEELIKKMHKRKTDIFIELIETGSLPLRPGVHRLMKELMANGMIIAICTTANKRSANAIAKNLLGDINISFILAGDVVKEKKPAPEIYLMALEKTGLNADQCVVVEDSYVGVTAAKSAGMHVLATTNEYTVKEDLSLADMIVSCLGDSDGEKGELKAPASGIEFNGVLYLKNIIRYFNQKNEQF